MKVVNASRLSPPGQPRRTRLAAIRVALWMTPALIVICAVLGSTPISAQELPNTPRAPFLLVANPDLPDPTFQQTVILILPSSEPPIVAGIIVNKPTKVTLGQLFGHSFPVGNRAQSVYFGGPVDLASPLILMRTERALSATTHLFENVYMSEDDASVREFIERPQSEKDVRLYLGRAQWTADQLHSEIVSGAWVVAAASPDRVFSADPAGLWQRLVQQAKLRQIGWIPPPASRERAGRSGSSCPLVRNCVSD